ncbi:hypothetical protein AB0F88_11000 [Streptosporangium sp. NPDC023963]|uniref:hypothetical protein n=1 Tax=Streptosporangium sp. NPDC023963 TaxID=3155608 RepID=UPI003448D82B
MQALQTEARGLVAGVHYGMELQPDQTHLWAYDRLVEVAKLLELPPPPALRDVLADIDGWAVDGGLYPRRAS